MLTPEQARELKAAGLDYYNHNLDTSPRYYEKIISTRSYKDRLDTLEAVREAGMHVCCGGIVGMGEEPEDRVQLLHILATMPVHPQSVPINHLVRVAGTPLQHAAPLPHHLEQPAARVMVVLVLDQMPREVLDAPREHGDLDLRRAGVALVGLVLLDDLCLVLGL